MRDTYPSDILHREPVRDPLAEALADDHPLNRLDHFLEALARLREDKPVSIAQCSLWRLPESGPAEMQRIRGRYLVHGADFDEKLLGQLFATHIGPVAEPGLLVLRRQLAEAPNHEVIGDYASILGPDVWRSLQIYKTVQEPLGLYNGFTHYWRIDPQRCLNTTLWLSDAPEQPDERIRSQARPLFLLAKPLIERVFLRDVIGRAMDSLTERQSEVLHLVLAGFSEKQIAGKLHRSGHTVHSHIRELYRQFEVQSRAELMALFVDEASLPAPGDEGEPRGREMTG